MVVGKLRMKNTEPHPQPSEVHKQRKRRHKTRSPSVDPPPEPYGPAEELDRFPSGSSTASRAFKANKGKSKQEPFGTTRDELVIQWTTTSSSVANRLLSIPSTNCREFEMKLQDALNSENEDIRLESIYNDDLHLPRRWQNHQSHTHFKTDLNGHQLAQMESEDYDEYIRKRMWSQTNRKQYIYSKEQEERRRQERERDRLARKKFRAEAKLSAERDTLKTLKQKTKARQRCRDNYFRRWELLNSLLNSSSNGFNEKEKTSSDPKFKTNFDDQIRQIVSFEEIPWPIYSSEVLDDNSNQEQCSSDIDKLNLDSIKEFLIGHLSKDDPQHLSSKKKIIRSALLTYHPDRFDRLLPRIKDSNQAAHKAKEWGLRVSQVLNELNNQTIN